MAPALEVSGVRKAFDGRTVLEDVTLTVAAGEADSAAFSFTGG